MNFWPYFLDSMSIKISYSYTQRVNITCNCTHRKISLLLIIPRFSKYFLVTHKSYSFRNISSLLFKNILF